LDTRPAIVLTGIGASAGVTVGSAFVLDQRKLRTPRFHLPPGQEAAELQRLKVALERSDQQLREMKAKVEALQGDEHTLILEAHRLMLHDPDFVTEIRRLIESEHVNAEWAVRRSARRIRQAFGKINDVYFRERKQDVDFVADRVVRNLMGERVDAEPADVPEGAVVVARDLSPADAALLLQPGRIAGLVTDRGTKTSHTAIVAHARGIPAVVGVVRASELVATGDELALDGDRGVVVLRPTEEQMRRFLAARRRHEEVEARLVAERQLPSVTSDGHEVRLHANIEFEEEVGVVERVGAMGIGLYRTEFLYLGRRTMPDEEEHYRAYRAVLSSMKGRPVTIRTLDVGGDKMPVEGRGGRPHEPNPAMGLRAIRYCMRYPDVFHTQLRALLRASVHGNLKIMFPMISGLTELRDAKAALERAREELLREGVPVADDIEVGVMIEMPSAALMADRIAQEVDFFSIGTNDLIQYALAIDRQNRDVAYLYRPLHLSILRMLQFTVEAAHAHGVRVAICGEMAGEPHYVLVLLGLGVDELSTAPASIPLLRRLVRAATLEEARQMLSEAMSFTTADEIEHHVRRVMQDRFADLLGGGDELEDLLRKA